MPRSGGSYRVDKKGAKPVLQHRTQPASALRASAGKPAPASAGASAGGRPAPETDNAPADGDKAAGKSAAKKE